MTPTPPKLYIADPSDDTHATIYIDLNGLEWGSSTGWGLVHNIDLGSIDLDQQWFTQRPFPPSRATSGVMPVTMTIPLYGHFSSYTELRAAYLKLMDILAQGGVMVWEPNPSLGELYIDYIPSDLPGLLRGQESAQFKILSLLQDPDGLPLVIERLPYLRGPVSAQAAQDTAMSNKANKRRIRVNNPGNADALGRITVSPNVADGLVQWRCGRRSGLTEDEATEFANNMWTQSAIDMTILSGAETANATDIEGGVAGSNNVRKTTFINLNERRRRLRAVFSPTGAGTLSGRWRVGVLMKTSIGGGELLEPNFVVQLRYGYTDADTVLPVPLEPVGLFAGKLESEEFMMVHLGEAHFERIAHEMVFDIAAESDTASSYIIWDSLVLTPADEDYIECYQLALRSQYPQEMWTGAELDLDVAHLNLPSTDATDDFPSKDAAEVEGQSAVLGRGDMAGSGERPGVTDQAVGTKPDSGLTLPLGAHKVWAHCTLIEPVGDEILLGHLRARRFAGGSWSDFVKVGMWAPDGQRATDAFPSIIFNCPSESNAWQFQVVMTAGRYPQDDGEVASREIIVNNLFHSWVRETLTGEEMVVDGFLEEAYVNSGTPKEMVAPVGVTGYMTFPPGDTDLIFDFGMRPVVGMAEFDPREVLTVGAPRDGSGTELTHTVTIDLVPRYRPQ